MLFSPLMALPSGGKFTHGTSGSITSNGNNMNIIGNGPSSVIQWGGGFSIGKGESVNFGGNSKNYLNIAHGTSKSMIEGLLNANGKNVFLINPNGVIITKTGTINANRFVASTSSMDSKSMQAFADMKTLEQGLSFSPIFKPHKAGNVVNMGNINANNVLLIGNKVSIDGGHINGKHNDNVSGDALKNPSGNTADKVHLVGNEVNILVDGIKSNSIIASAYSKGALQQSTTSYYNYGNSLGKLNFITQEYNNIDKTNLGNKKLVTKDKFEKHATIGSDIDWFYFAKGWNENKNDMRDFFGTYKLVDDIDFGANCKNGVCSGQNYANYWVDLNGDGIKQDNEVTNMIVGLNQQNAFDKIFDGQGYTLSNINIDVTAENVKDKLQNVGIFGYTMEAILKDINIDYMDGSINGGEVTVGGFVGIGIGSFENIYIQNINNIIGNTVGGFCGTCSGSSFKNISISNVNKILSTNHAGGFVGHFRGGYFNADKIVLDNIKNIISYNDWGVFGYVGGFAGWLSAWDPSIIKNVTLSRIGNLKGLSIGGFAGSIFESLQLDMQNISVEILGQMTIENNGYPSYVGGFIGGLDVNGMIHSFSNIYMYFGSDFKLNSDDGWRGIFFGYTNLFEYPEYPEFKFDNIFIYFKENHFLGATSDKDYWSKYNFIKYNDSTQSNAYNDFLSKANTIEKPSKPTNPTDPTDPSNPDVILGSDDLYSDIIMKWIIDELRKENYTIDIKNLVSLINAFKGLNKESSENEIKAVIKTHLGIKDDDKALSMAQSISFLLNYKEHNFDKRLNDEALAVYNNTIKPSVNNTLGLISYLDKNKDYLLE
ncbi:filamentous hemagglutinin N-terminal domain-containing protein [Campylobacter lari]|nr:filamentous hemagglutinin N-terminal domain-containing protein [Campylobacter lari]